MPLNVRRIFASFSLVLFTSIVTYSQTVTTPSQTSTAQTQSVSAPTAAEVMRERISKAKAYIVVKNYNAAIYELENIRRETNDPNINAMLNVLLMHSYLEQTDYKRAQTFLAGLYKDLKANKPNAMTNYYSVAGQIVKGAKNQLERYRSIGLNVADRNLPIEALVDIEKMRETLETVVEQTKSLSTDKKQTVNALPILEEATNARVALAKDDYDANRWKQSVTDAREMLINSSSTITNAIDGTTETTMQNTVASNTATADTTNIPKAIIAETTLAFQPVTTTKTNQISPSDAATKSDKTAEKSVEKPEISRQPETVADNDSKPLTGEGPVESSQAAKNENTPQKEEIKTEPSPNMTQSETPKTESPMTVGSLIEYATKRVNPVYPTAARSVRLSGIVRVDVLVDEMGKVIEVQNTNGPSMLQRAALDAIRKWQFKPFTRAGQPVRAAGFVNFNFSL